MNQEEQKNRLMELLSDNFKDYQVGLLTYDRQELIDQAERIAAVIQAYRYLTKWHDYEESQLNYLLEFQNPLELVADNWQEEYQPDDSIFQNTRMEEICRTVENRKLYPTTDAKKTVNPLRKFLNIEIESALRQLMAQKTIRFQTDLNYALEAMCRGALSEDATQRNFILLFRKDGVECLNERDTFIGKDYGFDNSNNTSSYNTCQFYHTMTAEPVLAYSVEITGYGKNVLRGNLYEQDYHQFAEFASYMSSPFTEVTLTFASNHQESVPQKEFDIPCRNNLEFYHGKVMEVRNEAEDETVVQGALQREHERRERLAKGKFQSHIQRLNDQRIQTEANRILAAFQSLTEPNSPHKTHLMVRLSEEFAFLSGTKDTDLLLDKIHAQLKNDSLHMSGLKDEKGLYCFLRPETLCVVRQEHKLSIKEQLTTPPVQGEISATKSKDKEVR